MGDFGTSLYVIRSGEARIHIGDIVFESVGPGGVVGEMAMLDSDVHVRSATVIAAAPTQVVEVARSRLLESLQLDPDVLMRLCQVTIRRLRATTFLTYHDPVTLLPNRYRFQEICRTALLRAARRGTSVGLMFVGVDDIKTVNASLGYAAADELLRAVGRRMSETLHEIDTIARLGATDFAVLLEDLGSSSQAVSDAQALLDAMLRPFEIGGQSLYLSASIGIGCYPQDGENWDTLSKSADSAMHAARATGRNIYRFYSPDLHALAVESLRLRSLLRRAIERGEFHLNYQPRVDIASGRITVLEALLRWQHPELGLVPPSKFIPIAEQAGMIEGIGDWVLRSACTQLKRWHAHRLDTLRLSVNLSARQLRRSDLPHRIAATLAECGLEPSHIELEITESAVMEDPARTVYLLKELRAMGFGIALDDFGTEYASLGYLKQFPLDYMKIDQSFVRGLPLAREDAAIAKAVITLAKNLGLKVIAEGVETREQLAFLAEHGCEEYQGYLFARPLCAEEAEALVRREQRD